MKKDERFKMLIILAACCAFCGIYMIIKHSYMIAAFIFLHVLWICMQRGYIINHKYIEEITNEKSYNFKCTSLCKQIL